MMAINLLKYFDEGEISKIKNILDYENESELYLINSDDESIKSKTVVSFNGKSREKITGGLPDAPLSYLSLVCK